MKRNVWIAMITIVTVCCVIGGTFHHIFGHGTGFFGRGGIENMESGLEAFDTLRVDVNLMDVTVTAGERFDLRDRKSTRLNPSHRP